MNYGELKNYLRTLVNRTDFPDTLAAQFIEQSQVRIERRLRLTAMEKFVDFTLTSGSFRVPSDLLDIIDIWSGSREMERVDTSRYLRTSEGPGEPRVFFQSGHSLFMRPVPPSDLPIKLRYYAAQPRLTLNTDTNLWSMSAVDALVYGAAELAGDYYEDERLARYSQKFETSMLELEEQSYREDFSGPMTVSASYSYPED